MSQQVDWGGDAVPSISIQEATFGQTALAIRPGHDGQRDDQLRGMVSVGGLAIPAVKRVDLRTAEQVAPPLREGNAGRADRQHVRQFKLEDYSGGLGKLHGSETVDANRTRYSDGLWAFQPNRLTLPPRIQQQTALHATDISGFNAANLRAHAVDSTLGQSKRRPYIYLGKKMYRATSDSDHSLADSTLALTNNITAAWEGYLNGTRYHILGTDGDTDDAVAVSNPTATVPTNTKAWAYTAGDWIGGGIWLSGLGGGYNVLYGKIAGVEGLHYLRGNQALLTAPTPMVLAATKDILGDIAPVTTSAVSPARGGLGRAGDVAIPAIANAVSYTFQYWGTWSSAGNIVSSDNSYATAVVNMEAKAADGDAVSPAGGLSDELLATDFNLSAVPEGAIITGIEAIVEAHESNANDEIRWVGIRLYINGSQVGINMADGTEVTSSTNTTKTFGASTARWGTSNLVGRDVRKGLSLGLQFACYEIVGDGPGGGSNSATGQINVDHLTVTLTYQMPGTSAYIPAGGHLIGADMQDPHTLYIAAPPQTELASINVPRGLYKAVITYDPESDRLTVELTKVATTLDSIAGGCVLPSGVLVWDLSGKNCVLVRRDGGVTDLGFGGDQGYTESWRILNAWPCDKGFVAQVVKDDNTVQQDWLCTGPGKWHAISPRETIAAEPIRYAQAIVGSELRRRYRIYPATTNTAVSRTYQPADYDQSPLNDGEIKANGTLWHWLPNLDIGGPEESLKSLLTARCFSHDVSATLPIYLAYSIDGGDTIVQAGSFTAYGQKITLPVPETYQGLMIGIGLDNPTDSASTPDANGIVLEIANQWSPLRQFVVVFEPFNPAFTNLYQDGPISFFDAMEEMSLASPAFEFEAGGVKKLVSWDRLSSSFLSAAQPGYMASAAVGKEAELVLTEIAQ